MSHNRRLAAERIAEFEKKSPEEQKVDKDKVIIPLLKSLNEQVDKLRSSLETVDDKTGLNALMLLLKAEQLKLSLEKEDTAIVHIKTDASGGNNKTTQNLFTGTKLFHTGGSVITFMLFDREGSILFSKTYCCATEYTKFKKSNLLKLQFLKNF